MTNFMCLTCGTQFAESDAPPERCPVCEDARQYVGWDGQRWTTMQALGADHRTRIEEDAGILGIGIDPKFAIGQRALLVENETGNILWDCVPLVDDRAVAAVRDRGGLAAIAISHPHYYSAMVEWSRALGGVPIFLHEADRDWVMRPDPALQYWGGDSLELPGGFTLLRLGGHFAGGAVLHDPRGAGALFTGDIIQVVMDRRWVSFMYSYPNLIPLPAAWVRGTAERLEALDFERIYGAFWGRVVSSNGKDALRRSAARYIRAPEDGARPAPST